MNDIMRLCFFCIVGVMLAMQCKSVKQEYAYYIGIGIALVIVFYVIGEFRPILLKINEIKQYMGGSGEFLKILFQVLGITYLCEFSASVCKDAGFGTVAEQIGLLGKLAVLYAGLPVLLAVVEQIRSFAP